jgi:hypothetical protein
VCEASCDGAVGSLDFFDVDEVSLGFALNAAEEDLRARADKKHIYGNPSDIHRRFNRESHPRGEPRAPERNGETRSAGTFHQKRML